MLNLLKISIFFAKNFTPKLGTICKLSPNSFIIFVINHRSPYTSTIRTVHFLNNTLHHHYRKRINHRDCDLLVSQIIIHTSTFKGYKTTAGYSPQQRISSKRHKTAFYRWVPGPTQFQIRLVISALLNGRNLGINF